MELIITTVASDGRGVGRAPNGKVVFVEGALPGETVEVEVTDDRSRFSSAHVLTVRSPSPERAEAPCPHVAAGCGGCQWQHVSTDGQRRLKEDIVASTVKRLARFEPPLLLPTVTLAPWSYRTSVRLGVGSGGRPGFRAARSHDLVAGDECLIVHPLLHDLIALPLPGVAEVTWRCGARTGERLVRTRPASVPVDVPPDVSRRCFHEEAAGMPWRISAESFFQSRPDGADALADLVAAAAAEMEGSPGQAVDLYSGVGLFAGVLARAGWSVTAVEGSRSSVADARVNLEALDVTVVGRDVNRWRPRPRQRSASEGRRSRGGIDLVVADPSRAGLGRSGVATVAACSPARVVLISCDVASLGRDVGLLREAGYSLTSMQLVDLFPHSFHVEVVAVLDPTHT